MGSPRDRQRQPLRTSPNGSCSQAALTGANLAFIKSLPPAEAKKYLQRHSPPPLPAHPGNNDHDNARQTRSPVGHRDVSGGNRPPPELLRLPKRPQNASNPSTSSLTATLAAARALPLPSASASHDNVSVRSTSQASVRSPAQPPVRANHNVDVKAKAPSPDKLDQTPIPPTSSLVDMFERKGPPPAIKAPKPTRKPALLRNQSLEPITTRLEQLHRDSSDDEAYESARDHLSPLQPSKPALPPARRSAKPVDSKQPTEPSIHVQPPSRSISRKNSAPRVASSPAPSPNTHTTKPIPVPTKYSPNHLAQPSITAAYHQLHPRRMTPLKSGDSLANAIVASSLASSRAPSPTKLPPPATGRRPSHSSFFSRTPSPPKKGMRHTMRKAASDSDSSEDEDPYSKHKKKRFIKKHPNKHHEGDRKRWRDAVTMRERKRYEGVWAANKGICVQYTASELDLLSTHPEAKESEKVRISVGDQVADLVARDIWMRSRLPMHELEQVWDLVDTQQCRRLHRDEFVVALWLIDQRLKGRKLPVKVSDSVWNSVRLLSGIKVRKG